MQKPPGPNGTSAREQKDDSKPGAGEEKKKEVGRRECLLNLKHYLYIYIFLCIYTYVVCIYTKYSFCVLTEYTHNTNTENSGLA